MEGKESGMQRRLPAANHNFKYKPAASGLGYGSNTAFSWEVNRLRNAQRKPGGESKWRQRR